MPAKRPASPFTPARLPTGPAAPHGRPQPRPRRGRPPRAGRLHRRHAEGEPPLQAMLHAPRSLARPTSLPLDPRRPRVRHPSTDRRPVLRGPLWTVPLWPDLRFEVLVAPNGVAWNELLVRAPARRSRRRPSTTSAPGPARSTRSPAPSPPPAPWRARPRPAGAGVHRPGRVRSAAAVRGGVHVGVAAARRRQRRAALTTASATTGTDSAVQPQKQVRLDELQLHDTRVPVVAVDEVDTGVEQLRTVRPAWHGRQRARSATASCSGRSPGLQRARPCPRRRPCRARGRRPCGGVQEAPAVVLAARSPAVSMLVR